MSVRGLKITKCTPYTHLKIYPYETRRCFFGGDEYDAATIGASWYSPFNPIPRPKYTKIYFTGEYKGWGKSAMIMGNRCGDVE
jgi:hypothetical protein